jgi:hypothetical protein
MPHLFYSPVHVKFRAFLRQVLLDEVIANLRNQLSIVHLCVLLLIVIPKLSQKTRPKLIHAQAIVLNEQTAGLIEASNNLLSKVNQIYRHYIFAVEPRLADQLIHPVEISKFLVLSDQRKKFVRRFILSEPLFG